MALDYEACWKRAQEQGKEKAAAMWPPHLTAQRLRAEYEYSLEFYRQMTTPPDLSCCKRLHGDNS